MELLLSRVELLKMQTGCPFDLKEAVCTIIYAAPRLSQKVHFGFAFSSVCLFVWAILIQLQELTEVRHQFIEKYGKPFAQEAMENKVRKKKYSLS